ncbi:MAG: hypothetical protein JNN00_19020 [Chitinophagaceae bacterium]|nr:hypothetical protein [Chitinophagaceae bacterium]
MKKIFSLFLLLTWGMITWGQQTPDRNVQAEKEKYLRKSRLQKTVAWVLVGAGTVCLVAPSLDGSSGQNEEGGWFDFSGLERTLDAYAYITGAVLVAGGIGLFIAAANNKQKAAAISLLIKPERTEYYTMTGGHRKFFPAAGIRIQLK